MIHMAASLPDCVKHRAVVGLLTASTSSDLCIARLKEAQGQLNVNYCCQPLTASLQLMLSYKRVLHFG